MSNFLNSFLTALGILLAIPTALILISWNALPGDSLYGLKRGLESVAFILTKDTPLATAFSLNFTDRRFSEANILLAQKGSTVGYTLLVAEAQKTKDVIVQKNDTQSATELTTKIDLYEKTIDEKKFVLQSQQPVAQGQIPFIPPAPTTLRSVDQPPRPQGTPFVTQSGKTPPPATGVPTRNQQTIEDLDKTKKDLEKIKDEIKKDLPEKETKNQPGSHEEKSQEKDQNRNKNH